MSFGSLLFTGDVNGVFQLVPPILCNGNEVNGSTADFTIELWAKLSGAAGTQPRLWSFGTGFGNNGALLALFIDDSTHIGFTFNGVKTTFPVETIVVGVWHFYTVQCVSQILYVYQDGVQLGSVPLPYFSYALSYVSSSPYYDNSGSQNFSIGGEATPTLATTFAGNITNIRYTQGGAQYPAQGPFAVPTTNLTNDQAGSMNVPLLLNASSSSLPFADSGGRAFTYSNLVGSGNYALNTFTSPTWSADTPYTVPCFAKGTRIMCADGSAMPIESLREGDYVRTGDGRVVPIVEVRSFKTPGAPRAWLPIDLLAKDGTVAATLSPGHAVWEPSTREFRLAGSYVDEDMGTWRGRRHEDLAGTAIEYWHIVLPDYATDSLVLASGMMTEALDGGSAFETGTAATAPWVGVHPLQRHVRFFAPESTDRGVMGMAIGSRTGAAASSMVEVF